MKIQKLLFSLLVVVAATISVAAQTIPFRSLAEINTRVDLAACNDSSIYHGDTIVTVGIVVTDGGLSEVASGSVGGGYRPFIHIVDTANGGAGNGNGIEVMGIYQDAQGSFQANSLITNLLAGDVVEITGYINSFNNGLQITTLDANSISLIGLDPVPTADTISVGLLNDPNRINLPLTGEAYEGTFVTFTNVTVSEVIPFGNGRISFNVIDNVGNKINVSDRFLAMKTASHQVVNPASPSTSGTGNFVAPVPGTFYNSISGIIRHDGNGCFTGGGSRGYEINPFDDSHFNIGFAPPFITDVERDPLVPNPNQDVDITATITDFDGTVDSVSIGWSADPNLSPSQFPVFSMSLAIGSSDEYEYTIPLQANNTLVRYYIYAEDDAANPSYFPNTPTNQVDPNFTFYNVRADGLTIADVQFSLAPNGDSPYLGETVKVKGVVSASAKAQDLGYVYIQDPNFTEYAGLALVGNPDLANLYRNEWVEVEGQIEEEFGFTRMVVSSVSGLGMTDTIQPISLDPSDSLAYSSGDWEKYEGMLVAYTDPNGGKLYITDADAGFGDYAVATDPTFELSNNRAGRVLAGRQSNSAFSSLYVQLVTDSAYETQDGIMFVGPIETSDTMTMDAVVGLLGYSFSNYRVLPRANDDFIGLNVTLDPVTSRPNNVSIEEVNSNLAVNVYPNPTQGLVNVQALTEPNFKVQLLDLNGRVIIEENSTSTYNTRLDLSGLAEGIYLLNVRNQDGSKAHTAKVIVRK
jgi:hypothetical protein